MKGTGSGVNELGRDRVGADPAHLGMFARFTGSPVHYPATKTTVRKPLAASTPQPGWRICRTRVPSTCSSRKTVEFTTAVWTDFLAGAKAGEFDVKA